MVSFEAPLTAWTSIIVCVPEWVASPAHDTTNVIVVAAITAVTE
jgi:hypothetical protein